MVRWTAPALDEIKLRNPAALTDVVPLLERLVSTFDGPSVARLLGTESETVVRWMTRQDPLPEEFASRIMDLHDVFSRALRVFQPRTAMDWLVGREPFLDYARPIDILVARGSAPLLDALRGHESGGYA